MGFKDFCSNNTVGITHRFEKNADLLSFGHGEMAVKLTYV